MIQSLDVILWDRKAGTLVLSKTGYKEQICFYFNPDFVKSGLDIAPLRASVSGVAARQGLPIYPDDDKIFKGLPSFIADSMPDHWGNTVFNEWAKINGIKRKDISALDILAYIGRRGMGALEFVPPTSEGLETPFKVQIERLSILAQKVMDDAKSFHTTLSPSLAIESLFKVGTSAGGRRPKAVINLNTETQECYSGQVATPVPGFTPMIIKFDEHGDMPSAMIEYSYFLMASAAGLKMMPCRLLSCGKESHFLTERFDRRGTEKLHVQTLAAMSPLSSSYEDLFTTAQRIGIPPEEIQMLFRQMVLNILAANVDDHNKNFSFLMTQSGEWHISPAYDFTFTVDTSAPYYINRHSMSVNGTNQGITRDDLLSVAKQFNIKRACTIIDRSIETVTEYRKYAVEAGVPEHWIKKIEYEIADRVSLIK